MIERKRNLPNKSILFQPNRLNSHRIKIKITEPINKNLLKGLKSSLVSEKDEQNGYIKR